MDKAQVKNILNWKTNRQDDYIDEVIPLMINLIKDYCNNPFVDDEGNEVIGGGAQIAIAKWIEYNTIQSGVDSRSQGVSYSYTTDIPESIKALLRPYKRVRF